MTPHYRDDWLTVYAGDCRTVLATLPEQSVNCVVTSPPYWGLRDYGTEGQLGLEATPEEYVANLVAVFREVKRVLRDDGTVWINLGDSYASDMKGSGGDGTRSGLRNDGRSEDSRITSAKKSIANQTFDGRRIQHGLKPKDLVGIPWRVAFALQADGWYLRSDIIWAKPNPMPESVTDRPTKAHEYLFLLSKSPRYYFDQEAVREAVSPNWQRGAGAPMPELGDHRLTNGSRGHQVQRVYDEAKGANLRSVWTIATRPYPGAHFAVFPPELPERCIKAGSSERGVCPECGAPWERVVEREPIPRGVFPSSTNRRPSDDVNDARTANSGMSNGTTSSVTTGWTATCGHPLKPAPATILDPFAGSGTVGLVANRLSRRAILIDLNPDYIEQQMKRNAQVPVGL